MPRLGFFCQRGRNNLRRLLPADKSFSCIFCSRWASTHWENILCPIIAMMRCRKNLLHVAVVHLGVLATLMSSWPRCHCLCPYGSARLVAQSVDGSPRCCCSNACCQDLLPSSLNRAKSSGSVCSLCQPDADQGQTGSSAPAQLPSRPLCLRNVVVAAGFAPKNFFSLHEPAASSWLESLTPWLAGNMFSGSWLLETRELVHPGTTLILLLHFLRL